MSIPTASRRLLKAAEAMKLTLEVLEFPEGTKTAADAAAAIGCDVSAIVKSLVFTVDGAPQVALIPGDRRLDPEKLAAAAGGSKAEQASLDVVREATGFVAGGTPPFGYPTDLPVWADDALRRNSHVWAAAGTPTTVFGIELAVLIEMSGAIWADLS